jgi:hypothetical protein
MYPRSIVALGWLAGLGANGTPAVAGDWSADVRRTDSPPPRYETSTGIDVVKHAWSVHGSFTASPFGGITADGWRVRLGTGYGQYRYDRDVTLPGRTPVRPAHGHSAFAEALVGYQLTLGRLTAKAFAGILGEQSLVAIGNAFTLFEDPADPHQGTRYGFKGALETWLDLGGRGFLQVDAGWSSPSEAYAGRARLGYRLGDRLSFGPEAALHGSTDSDATPTGRGGAFARYEWGRGEASISAGVTGNGDEVDGAYGTMALSFRF